MKKILAYLFLALTITLSTTLSVSATNVIHLNEDTESTVAFAEIVESQQSALQAYDILWHSFKKDLNGEPIYPDNYAGEYIDQNGKLVIMLVDNSAEAQKIYLDIVRNSKSVIFEQATYSLKYLLSLEYVADDLLNQGYQVVEFGVDRSNNEFFISLETASFLQAQSSIKKFSSSLPIRFEETNAKIQSTAQLWGGDRITNEDTGLSMSVGIGGTYQGQNAILTCGHGNEKYGILFPRYPYIKYGSNRTGQVAYQRANLTLGDTTINSLGDFAIVKLTGADVPTNRVFGNVYITGTYSSVPEGTAIYKYGATSKYSYGYVTAMSIAVTYQHGLFNIYYVRGLYRSTMTNASGTDAISPGDSGGTVYIKDGGANKIHGIVTARVEPTSGNPATIMYSTPIYYVQHAGFTVKLN